MEYTIPRSEFPRPDFERESWLCLNGEWEFRFDPNGEIETIQRAESLPFPEKILVPYCYESKLSGIGRWDDCETIWYRRSFTLTQDQAEKAVLLKFGAVDYEAFVWVNGSFAGTHKGGHSSFEFDISPLVQGGENRLVVQAVDTLETAKPRGKQSWRGEKFGCWYTPTSGIWQSVWLEFTEKSYIRRVQITPDIDALTAKCEIFTNSTCPQTVSVEAEYTYLGKRKKLPAVRVETEGAHASAVLSFQDRDLLSPEELYWSPEHPHLVDVTFTLESGSGKDLVKSYFGLRKISTQNGVVLLNNSPYLERLVLDQGYWEESLLTPPTEEAIVRDIRLTKELGFNGARKHQKIEDPRYYYWADKMGLLVWGELPSSYEFNTEAMANSIREMTEFVFRDYNHPCIVTWVTLNESWGVWGIQKSHPQQDYARGLYYAVKAMDPTRLISTNDGWEQITEGDICAVHDYSLFPDNLNKYDDMETLLNGQTEGRMLYAEGNRYAGQPIMMTEYGGIAFSNAGEGEWGYFGKVTNQEEYLARLAPVTEFFVEDHRFAGFCYTQLTDVMHEVNGLLTPSREPKIPIEKLRKSFGKIRY